MPYMYTSLLIRIYKYTSYTTYIYISLLIFTLFNYNTRQEPIDERVYLGYYI